MDMLRWNDLTHLSDESLEAQNLAVVNLACAVDLPGAEMLDVAACLQTLDSWTGQIRRETARYAPQFHRDASAFENSWPYFRMLVMTTVLQQDFGVRYDPALIDRDDFFSKPEYLFVHGVLEGKGGTCTSLPPLYVSIGRRLGYPLRLVQTHSHLFARWDDPRNGERLNIECTANGLNCHSDDYYRSWPQPTTPRDEQRYGWLVSQTPREDLAWFLITRGHCLLENHRYRQAVEAYSQAVALTQRHHGYEACVQNAVSRWHVHGEPKDTSDEAKAQR
jgi:hypothetical protein